MLARLIGIKPYRKKRLQRWSRGILAAGFIVACVAAGLTYRYVQEAAGRTATAGPTVAVVVAARDVAARTRLAPEDLRVALIDPAFAPVNVFRSVTEATGRVTAMPLVANEPLIPSKLVPPGPQEFSVIGAGERVTPSSPDHRALSLGVPEASAVGGVLQPGDVVDILVATRLGTDPTKDISSRIAFQSILILARKDTVYTIRVDAGDAEKIAYLEASGAALRFLLRSPGDDRAPRATGADATTVGPLLRVGSPTR